MIQNKENNFYKAELALINVKCIQWISISDLQAKGLEYFANKKKIENLLYYFNYICNMFFLKITISIKKIVKAKK
jgi:hypothetical protein